MSLAERAAHERLGPRPGGGDLRAGGGWHRRAWRRSSRCCTPPRWRWCPASKRCARPPARARSAALRAHHRRADLRGDRDRLGPRRRLPRRRGPPARAPQAAVRARRRAGVGAGRHRDASRGPTTASSGSSTPSTTAAWRRASNTWRGATTPSACTRTWGCATPIARCACATACAGCCRCCWRSPPTPPTSTAATRACTRRARRASPAASRAAACPTRSAGGAAYREYIEQLKRTNSIVEYTQVWWSVRPHFAFGTVEVRICDAQTHRGGVRGAGGTDWSRA